MTHLGS